MDSGNKRQNQHDGSDAIRRPCVNEMPLGQNNLYACDHDKQEGLENVFTSYDWTRPDVLFPPTILT